jgi:hypothetical protein
MHRVIHKTYPTSNKVIAQCCQLLAIDLAKSTEKIGCRRKNSRPRVIHRYVLQKVEFLSVFNSIFLLINRAFVRITNFKKVQPLFGPCIREKFSLGFFRPLVLLCDHFCIFWPTFLAVGNTVTTETDI